MGTWSDSDWRRVDDSHRLQMIQPTHALNDDHDDEDNDLTCQELSVEVEDNGGLECNKANYETEDNNESDHEYDDGGFDENWDGNINMMSRQIQSKETPDRSTISVDDVLLDSGCMSTFCCPQVQSPTEKMVTH